MRLWELSAAVPFIPAHPHGEPGNELLLLVSASSPFGFTQQPVRQGDYLAGLVEAIVLVCMFDGVAGNAAS